VFVASGGVAAVNIIKQANLDSNALHSFKEESIESICFDDDLFELVK